MTADAGGPYSCERGAVLRLDASRSRGDIGAYEWGFEAAPPERPPGPYDPEMDPPRADAKKTASSAGGASVVVCMDVMVRVTVTSKSGDAKRSSEPVRIACIPRTVKPADVSKTDEIKKANLPLFPGQFDLGRNVCALDDGPVGKDEAQHYYHRPPGLQSWLDVGYRVQQVDDSVGGPGPFHGFWLVWLPHTLPICRQRAVNRKLYPKDPEGVYQHNEQRKQPRPPPKKGSDAPHPYVCGMGRFAASVAAHEGKHTELILESARREFARVEQRRGPVDPAGRIEGLCFADRAKLVTGADVEILYSDEEVGKATSGKEAEERIHEMLVADGFDDYAIVYLPDGKGGWATKEGRRILAPLPRQPRGGASDDAAFLRRLQPSTGRGDLDHPPIGVAGKRRHEPAARVALCGVRRGVVGHGGRARLGAPPHAVGRVGRVGGDRGAEAAEGQRAAVDVRAGRAEPGQAGAAAEGAGRKWGAERPGRRWAGCRGHCAGICQAVRTGSGPGQRRPGKCLDKLGHHGIWRPAAGRHRRLGRVGALGRVGPLPGPLRVGPFLELALLGVFLARPVFRRRRDPGAAGTEDIVPDDQGFHGVDALVDARGRGPGPADADAGAAAAALPGLHDVARQPVFHHAFRLPAVFHTVALSQHDSDGTDHRHTPPSGRHTPSFDLPIRPPPLRPPTLPHFHPLLPPHNPHLGRLPHQRPPHPPGAGRPQHGPALPPPGLAGPRTPQGLLNRPHLHRIRRPRRGWRAVPPRPVVRPQGAPGERRDPQARAGVPDLHGTAVRADGGDAGGGGGGRGGQPVGSGGRGAVEGDQEQGAAQHAPAQTLREAAQHDAGDLGLVARQARAAVPRGPASRRPPTSRAGARARPRCTSSRGLYLGPVADHGRPGARAHFGLHQRQDPRQSALGHQRRLPQQIRFPLLASQGFSPACPFSHPRRRSGRQPLADPHRRRAVPRLALAREVGPPIAGIRAVLAHEAAALGGTVEPDEGGQGRFAAEAVPRLGGRAAGTHPGGDRRQARDGTQAPPQLFPRLGTRGAPRAASRKDRPAAALVGARESGVAAQAAGEAVVRGRRPRPAAADGPDGRAEQFREGGEEGHGIAGVLEGAAAPPARAGGGRARGRGQAVPGFGAARHAASPEGQQILPLGRAGAQPRQGRPQGRHPAAAAGHALHAAAEPPPHGDAGAVLAPRQARAAGERIRFAARGRGAGAGAAGAGGGAGEVEGSAEEGRVGEGVSHREEGREAEKLELGRARVRAGGADASQFQEGDGRVPGHSQQGQPPRSRRRRHQHPFPPRPRLARTLPRPDTVAREPPRDRALACNGSPRTPLRDPVPGARARPARRHPDRAPADVHAGAALEPQRPGGAAHRRGQAGLAAARRGDPGPRRGRQAGGEGKGQGNGAGHRGAVDAGAAGAREDGGARRAVEGGRRASCPGDRRGGASSRGFFEPAAARIVGHLAGRRRSRRRAGPADRLVRIHHFLRGPRRHRAQQPSRVSGALVARFGRAGRLPGLAPLRVGSAEPCGPPDTCAACSSPRTRNAGAPRRRRRAFRPSVGQIAGPGPRERRRAAPARAGGAETVPRPGPRPTQPFAADSDLVGRGHLVVAPRARRGRGGAGAARARAEGRAELGGGGVPCALVGAGDAGERDLGGIPRAAVGEEGDEGGSGGRVQDAAEGGCGGAGGRVRGGVRGGEREGSGRAGERARTARAVPGLSGAASREATPGMSQERAIQAKCNQGERGHGYPDHNLPLPAVFSSSCFQNSAAKP